MDVAERVVGAYSKERIERYTESVKQNGLAEHGFPRLTVNLGILVANGKKLEYKEMFFEMMELCCEEIPAALERNGGRVGNDFSVKEVVLCILEIEKSGVFDKSVTQKWRRELAKINPYTTYTKIAENPPKPVDNWAAFGAASEQIRKYAGIGDESSFIENQVRSQLFSFDENGMYLEPHEPLLYDFVTRLQLAMLLHFGYDGEFEEELAVNLEKSAELTLQMQSVTGEIPFGGRSNQFLHNEASYAALCEFYAVFFKKREDLNKAGMFKRAARLATENILYWLEKNPLSHIKNCYPTDSMYGCESYAYYDKYMVTTASSLCIACVLCEEEITEIVCPCENDDYTAVTSEHFHKVFLKYGDYFVQYDVNADEKYDASGLGRVHKRGAPSNICMSVPYPKSESAYKIDIQNLVPFAICGGIKVDNIFEYACEGGRYSLISRKKDSCSVSAKFEITTKSGVKIEEECRVSAEGVEITVKGYGDVAIQFPLFDFDGSNHSEKHSLKNGVAVTYCGYVCSYTTDGTIMDKGYEFANRNGHCNAYAAMNRNSVTLRIRIEEGIIC